MSFLSGVARLVRLVSFIFLATFTVAHGCASKRISSADLSRRSPTSLDISGDIANLLPADVAHNSRVFEEARRSILAIQTSSTCHKIAANQLLNVCHSFHSDDLAETEGLLERTKSVYAARLALCETGEGGAPVPLPCRGIAIISKDMRSEDRTGKSRTVEVVSGKELAHCVKALQKESNYWTSYSNNRQHALNICDGVRHHVDRDGALDFFIQLMGASQNMTVVLADSARQGAEEHERQRLRAVEVSELHQQNLETMNKGYQMNKEQFSSLMVDFAAQTDSIASKVRVSLEAASGDVNQIKGVFESSIIDMKDAIARTYETAAAGVSYLSAGSLNAIAQINEKALTAMKQLEGMDLYELIEMKQELSMQMQDFMRALFASQDELLAKSQETLQLSDKNLEKQRQMVEAITQTAQKASEVDEAVNFVTVFFQELKAFIFPISRLLKYCTSGELLDMLYKFVGISSAFIVIASFNRRFAVQVLASFVLIWLATIQLKHYAARLSSFALYLCLSAATVVSYIRHALLNNLIVVWSFLGILVTVYIIADNRRRKANAALQHVARLEALHEARRREARREANREANINNLVRFAAVQAEATPSEKDRFKRAATAPPRAIPPSSSRYLV